jgi:hypothetical protein
VKLTNHLRLVSVSRMRQYISMAWCSFKAEGQLYLYLTLPCPIFHRHNYVLLPPVVGSNVKIAKCTFLHFLFIIVVTIIVFFFFFVVVFVWCFVVAEFSK